MENTIHTFEESGLGKAPFTFIGVEMKSYQAHPTAPIQPGGTCVYCGAALMECCIIRDAEGKTFIVGSTCVNKTGDRGLINLVKREVTKKRKVARLERESKRIVDAKTQWEAGPVRSILSQQGHPAIPNKTLADYVDWMFKNAGHTGELKVTKLIEKAA